nr:hypothetical protein [Neorhizobium tomejilense]
MNTKTNSRTERFNATVKAGKKSYAPGTPVPIGGKDGISAEEAENIRHNFGDYTGGPQVEGAAGAALADAEISARDSQIETLLAEKRELEAKLADKTGLYDKLVIDHTKLGEDNLALGKRLEATEAENVKLKKPN